MKEVIRELAAEMRTVLGSLERGELSGLVVLTRASDADAWVLAVLGASSEDELKSLEAVMDALDPESDEVTLQ